MATDGGELDRSFDWAELVSQVVHPAQVEIIEALLWIGEPLSANLLKQVIDDRCSLSLTSYHLKRLAHLGVLEENRGRRPSGATERLYFFPQGR